MFGVWNIEKVYPCGVHVMAQHVVAGMLAPRRRGSKPAMFAVMNGFDNEGRVLIVPKDEKLCYGIGQEIKPAPVGAKKAPMFSSPDKVSYGGRDGKHPKH
ncbi:hypothetical protein SADUNF_Sadunf18G0020700 [Salix dunnii]|uniref:Uncharacterized protein n=1 Tax=Salix dunnii TaxID=1413687 RepID=A0A835J793_9ROSI|nr:hypothetical protein SADUNF_Sadunf18G0020700 [Salix dunnii]